MDRENQILWPRSENEGFRGHFPEMRFTHLSSGDSLFVSEPTPQGGISKALFQALFYSSPKLLPDVPLVDILPTSRIDLLLETGI